MPIWLVAGRNTHLRCHRPVAHLYRCLNAKNIWYESRFPKEFSMILNVTFYFHFHRLHHYLPHPVLRRYLHHFRPLLRRVDKR